MQGQVFAPPVPPFIRGVKRSPDEPGARHWTYSVRAGRRDAKSVAEGGLESFVFGYALGFAFSDFAKNPLDLCLLGSIA